MGPQAIQHSPFRAIELAGVRNDYRDLVLLGKQEPLKLARAYGCVNGELDLVRHGPVDLGGDCVQPIHALAHRGMSAGKRFRQHLVGVGGRAVLLRQRGLACLNGGYRMPGLLRHGFNLLIPPTWAIIGLSKWATDLHVAAQRADPHRGTQIGRFDDQVVADGHLHVSGMREDEIARPDLRERHWDPVV